MIESRLHRYRYYPLVSHNPADNSVSTLEREEIDFGASGFLDDLRSDMGLHSASVLTRAYPELVFTFHPARKKPDRKTVGWDYAAKRDSGWMTSRWKTAAEAAA